MWTKKWPTEPGWYWIYRTESHRPEVRSANVVSAGSGEHRHNIYVTDGEMIYASHTKGALWHPADRPLPPDLTAPDDDKSWTRLWTDYPITELGDTAGEEAPIREVTVLDYDGDKYCQVQVRIGGDGFETEIKAGYIYTRPGRHGDAPTWSPLVFAGDVFPNEKACAAAVLQAWLLTGTDDEDPLALAGEGKLIVVASIREAWGDRHADQVLRQWDGIIETVTHALG